MKLRCYRSYAVCVFLLNKRAVVDKERDFIVMLRRAETRVGVGRSIIETPPFLSHSRKACLRNLVFSHVAGQRARLPSPITPQSRRRYFLSVCRVLTPVGPPLIKIVRLFLMLSFDFPRPRVHPQFHLYVVGTEECLHSIAKSVIKPSKKEWEGLLKETLGDSYEMLCAHGLQVNAVCSPTAVEL